MIVQCSTTTFVQYICFDYTYEPSGGCEYCALKVALHLHLRSRGLFSLDGLLGKLDGLPHEVTNQILVYLEEVQGRNIPSVEKTYLRYVGRTEQYGRKSVTINFATEKDMDALKSIETFWNCVIDELPLDFDSILYSVNYHEGCD